MADDKTKHEAANDPGEPAADAAQAAEANDKAAGDRGSEDLGGDERDETARLAEDVAMLKDQLLRALAETENLRRRSQREREDAVRYAAVPLIKDLIGVADNLRRALDSISEEAAAGSEQVRTLRDGIAMTEKELLSIFERHGIRRIDPVGERLDPHNHEAMFEIPDPSAESGTVLQVLSPGYRLHDRLLRPAQVGVAKGGPAPKADPEGGARRGAGDDPNAGTGAPGAGGHDGNTSDAAPGAAKDAPGSRYDTRA